MTFGLGLRLGGFGAGSPRRPAAPTLAWLTTFSDTTPDFRATLPAGNSDANKNASAGDILTIYVNGSSVHTYTLQAADIVAGTVVRTLSAIAAGVRTATARLVRGARAGMLSNSVSFKIGKILIGYGQSNWLGHMAAASSPPAAGTGTTYWDGSAWATSPAVNGARELLNFLATDTGYPWGIISGGAVGVPIEQLMAGYGSGYFEALAASVAAAGGDADYIVWHQGEGNADGSGVTIASYLSNLDTLHQSLCTLVGKTRATLPLVVSSLATTSDTPTSANWDLMQRKLLDSESLTGVFYSHSNTDAVRRDSYHWDGASYGRSGRRYAQTVAKLLTVEAQPANWFVASAAVVDATHTDVTVTHKLGTDFTPTSGITGFDVSQDNGANWVPGTGARQSATVIRLTHSSIGTGQKLVRYQYGVLPDVSAPVLDNSSIAVPLNFTAGTVSTPASLPTPTFRTVVNGASFPTSSSCKVTGAAIGTAANDRFLIVAIEANNGINGTLTGFTLQVGGQTDIAMAVVSVVGPADGSVAFAYANVPAGYGTTADLVAQFSADMFSTPRFTIWTVPQGDLNSTTPTTGSAHSASNTTLTANVATTSGGFILAAGGDTAIGADTAVWSGSESYAKRGNDTVFAGGHHAAADASNVATSGSNGVTLTYTNAAPIVLGVAAWR
jgi:hypothetical protein